MAPKNLGDGPLGDRDIQAFKEAQAKQRLWGLLNQLGTGTIPAASAHNAAETITTQLEILHSEAGLEEAYWMYRFGGATKLSKQMIAQQYHSGVPNHWIEEEFAELLTYLEEERQLLADTFNDYKELHLDTTLPVHTTTPSSTVLRPNPILQTAL